MSACTWLGRAVMAAGSAGWAAFALAQYHIPQYSPVPLMIANNVVTQQIVQQAHRKLLGEDRAWSGTADPRARSSAAQTAARATTLAPPSAAYGVPARMAAGYPDAHRAETERIFRELLAGYNRIEKQFGIPANDVAGAVAAFVAGSWMAYRNADFPDKHFMPLVVQMRNVIGSSPDFVMASSAEKREMYEQMAILGMFMATTQMALKTQPQADTAAHMRQAAKGYLEQFLKTDAERVQITAQGLQLRP